MSLIRRKMMGPNSMSLAQGVPSQNKNQTSSTTLIADQELKIPQQAKVSQHLSWKFPIGNMGHKLNQLLKSCISTFHSCAPDERHQLMKKEVKKFEDFEVKDVHYMEIVSHWILPKVYYLEEKLREVKGISLSKYNKQKHSLLEKIKNGLRNYHQLKVFYEVAVFSRHELPEKKVSAKSTPDPELRNKEIFPDQKKIKQKGNQEGPMRKLKKNRCSSSSSSSESSQTQQISERQRSRNKKTVSMKAGRSRVVRKMK